MPYEILSDEKKGRIVGMHEGGMKSSNITFVLMFHGRLFLLS